MDPKPQLFRLTEMEGVWELILGTADFVSRPIIVMAQEQIIEFVDKNKPARLVINFKNVNHISSELITAMIRTRDHVVGHGGQMKFSHVNELVRVPFEITQLAGRLFTFYETTAEAVDSF